MANSKTQNEENLEQYTVAELRDMADAEGVDVPSHATKDEIIRAIEKGRKADARAGDAMAGDARTGITADEEGQLMATPTEEHPEVSPLALTGPVNVLPLSGIIADAFAIGRKYNVALADITIAGAVLQANLLLDTLPPGSLMQYVRIKHSQAGAGPSVTAVTAQVGDGTNSWGSAFDIFQAPSNTALSTAQLTASNIGPFAANWPIYLTLIATGGNLGVFTAGALSVWLRWTILE